MRQVDNFIFKTKKEFKHSYKIILKNIKHNFEDKLWTVGYKDEHFTRNRKKVIHIFGLSSAFGGSNFFSTLINGARYVPFYIVITEITSNSCEVLVISGGSENALGFEFGRNKKVAKLVLEFCSEFHH